MKLNSILYLTEDVERSGEAIDAFSGAAYRNHDSTRGKVEIDGISRTMLAVLQGFSPWDEKNRIEKLFELKHPDPFPDLNELASVESGLFGIVWRTDEAGYGDRFRFKFIFEPDNSGGDRSYVLRKITAISEKHDCNMWSMERKTDGKGFGFIDYHLNYHFFILLFEAMVGEYKAYVNDVQAMFKHEKSMRDDDVPERQTVWQEMKAAFEEKYGYTHNEMKTVESPGEFRHNGLHYPKWIETVFMWEDDAIEAYLSDGGRIFDVEDLLPRDALLSTMNLDGRDPEDLENTISAGYLQISEAVKAMMTTCVWRLNLQETAGSGFSYLIGDCPFGSRMHEGYTVHRFLFNLLIDSDGPHGRFGPDGMQLLIEVPPHLEEWVMRGVRKMKDGIVQKLGQDEDKFWRVSYEVQSIIARMIKSHFVGFYGIGLS